MIAVKLTVSSDKTQYSLTVDDVQPIKFTPAEAVTVVSGEKYTGDYEITPSTVDQTLATDHLFMTGNVTVKAIPNNYGLITYNGSFILVS